MEKIQYADEIVITGPPIAYRQQNLSKGVLQRELQREEMGQIFLSENTRYFIGDPCIVDQDVMVLRRAFEFRK